MIEAPFGKIKLKNIKMYNLLIIIISFLKNVIETNIEFHIQSIKAYFKSFQSF